MLIKRKSIEALSNKKNGFDIPSKPTRRSPEFDAILVSENQGIRSLHFGSEWVQGSMHIKKPNELVLTYSQQMQAWAVFHPNPTHILQLGLGAGSTTKFCLKHFPKAQITAVELNPEVVGVALSMFELPFPNARFTIEEHDAYDMVHSKKYAQIFDVVQIDLYDATDKGPVLDSADFYAGVKQCMLPGGIVTMNLFGDHPSFAKNIRNLKKSFGTVLAFPQVHDGNVVIMAFKEVLELDWDVLPPLCKQAEKRLKYPFSTWLKSVKTL